MLVSSENKVLNKIGKKIIKQSIDCKTDFLLWLINGSEGISKKIQEKILE